MIRFGRFIPVTIHPIFWLTAGIIGWINSWTFWGTIMWIGIILVSILIHEYGHALTARAFGQQAQIDLVALGGLTYHDGKKIKRWQDFIVVLMGPLAGLGLAFVCFFARGLINQGAYPAIFYILTLFFFINVFWTIVNLLPIIPLDGGQLLRIIMEGIFGYRGLKITLMIGIVLGAAAGTFALIAGYFLVGAIFLMLTFQSFTSWNQIKGMTYQDRDENIQKDLEEAQLALSMGQLDKAKEKLEKLVQKSRKGLVFEAASEQLAIIYDKEGNLDRVYQILKLIDHRLSVTGKCLLQRAAYYNKDYPLTLEIGAKCFQETQAYEIAYINALASACLKDVQASIGWLECALKHGMGSLKEVVAKPEFNGIRDHHVFQSFLEMHNL